MVCLLSFTFGRQLALIFSMFPNTYRIIKENTNSHTVLEIGSQNQILIKDFLSNYLSFRFFCFLWTIFYFSSHCFSDSQQNWRQNPSLFADLLMFNSEDTIEEINQLLSFGSTKNFEGFPSLLLHQLSNSTGITLTLLYSYS